jgi:hypothetical protein
MRTKAALLTIAALLATSALAQVDRVLHFSDARPDQEIQEIASVIRAITDIPKADVDLAEKSLSLSGTASQIALSEWLFTNLDKPVGDHPQPGQGAKYEYPVAADDIVRLFYLTNPDVPQGVQEIAIVVRSLSGIRRMFTYNDLRAIAVRGTADQVKLAEFFFDEMDKPAVLPSSSQKLRSSVSPELRMAEGPENLFRVFYLPNIKTVREFQEVATLVRTITEVRRMFTYSAPRAIGVRGTAEQIPLAEWLFAELDRASTPQTHPDTAAHEYRVSSARYPLVRVFYLSHAATREVLEQTATEVRSKTGSREVFTYGAPSAIVIRGSAEQIAQAGRLIQEQDK